MTEAHAHCRAGWGALAGSGLLPRSTSGAACATASPVVEALPSGATLAALDLRRGLTLKFMGSLPEFTPEHRKDTSRQAVGLRFRASTPHAFLVDSQVLEDSTFWGHQSDRPPKKGEQLVLKSTWWRGLCTHVSVVPA